MSNYDEKIYNPPPAFNEKGERTPDDELLKYLKRNSDDGMNYLRSNRAWLVADVCMGILYGDNVIEQSFRGLSRLAIKKLRRQIREIVANQSNVEQTGEVRTERKDDEQLLNQAEQWNALLKAWWRDQFVDVSIKGANQWAGGSGTGWIFVWPRYNCLSREVDITLEVLPYNKVIPFHPTRDCNIDKFHGIDIVLETPIPQAHAEFPLFKDKIQPDRFTASWMVRGYKKVRRAFRGIIARRAETRTAQQDETKNTFPVADLHFTFIQDSSYNETEETICMGKVNSHYYYEVPPLEGEVKTGAFIEESNDVSGEKNLVEEVRPATLEDTKLYPKGRMIIWCSGGILYDGPPTYGNGIPPVVPFYFEKLEGELLGYPVIMDSRSLEVSANNIVRSFETKIVGRSNPPIGVDERIPPKMFKMIQKWGAAGIIGKVFQYNLNILTKAIVPLIPVDFFKLENGDFEFLKFLYEQQDYLTGTNDFSAQARLRQLPAADTQEAIIQNLGTLATEQSRLMDKSIDRLIRLWFSYAPQVYTLKKRISILGSDAVSIKDIDYDPESLAPKKFKNDPRPLWLRLEQHLKNFSIYVAQNSTQQKNSYTAKLSLLQLQKTGAAIPSQLAYEAFTGKDDYLSQEKKYYEEQERKAEAAAKIQVKVKQIMEGVQANGGANSNGLMQELIQALSSGDANKLQQLMGNANQVGRPPTDNAPARLEIKKDETGIPRGTTATN